MAAKLKHRIKKEGGALLVFACGKPRQLAFDSFSSDDRDNGVDEKEVTCPDCGAVFVLTGDWDD